MLGCSPSPPTVDPVSSALQLEREAGSDSLPKKSNQARPGQTTIQSQVDPASTAHLPSQDDWNTEIQSELVLAQLNKIAAWVESGHSEDVPRETQSNPSKRQSDPTALRQSIDDLSSIVLTPCRFSHPTVSPAATVFERDGFTVTRSKDQSTEFTDLKSFLTACRLWGRAEGIEQHLKFKLFRVEPVARGFDGYDEDLRTRVRVELSEKGAGNQSVSQTTAIWDCAWRFHESGAPPQLLRLAVSDWEQVRFRGGPLFRDVTESVLTQNDSYSSQMLPGIPYWLSRLPKEFLGQFGHHGMAVGDVNGDGLDDVYVCDAGGLPNRLYVQRADGTAMDTSAQAGVDFLENSRAALIVDLDNDGDQDLVVSTDRFIHLCENNGAGQFSPREPVPVDADSFSLSAADYDADRDLDIYVCVYEASRKTESDRGLPFPIPYHDANNGGRNLLLQNEGDFRFVDVTDGVGLGQDNSRFSMAASWEDFDNDGDQDLVVANDFGRNCLYQNDDGQFVNIAAASGVEDHASGMSVSCGDFDRDGRADIYVGNMFSAAGNRVTYQRRFTDGAKNNTTTSHLQRMARGNSLFRNQGGMRFEDAADSLTIGPSMGRWAWASPFVDFTNDGWLDVVIANGYLTNEDSSDL